MSVNWTIAPKSKRKYVSEIHYECVECFDNGTSICITSIQTHEAWHEYREAQKAGTRKTDRPDPAL